MKKKIKDNFNNLLKDTSERPYTNGYGVLVTFEEYHKRYTHPVEKTWDYHIKFGWGGPMFTEKELLEELDKKKYSFFNVKNPVKEFNYKLETLKSDRCNINREINEENLNNFVSRGFINNWSLNNVDKNFCHDGRDKYTYLIRTKIKKEILIDIFDAYKDFGDVFIHQKNGKFVNC